jgi:Zn-dependent protease
MAEEVGKESAYHETRRLVDHPPPVTQRSKVLLITLGLFVVVSLSRGSEQSFSELAILIGVLLVHEAGHAIAMRVSGYTDVRVFFIPFFGAAAAGKKRGVARWKEGVVLLAGPLPGIIAGAVMFAVGVEGAARTAAMLLLVVNALNLLPVSPLDGGQLFQLVVFSRNHRLEVGALVLAGVVLVLGFAATTNFVLLLLGAMLLGSVPLRVRLLAAATELQPLGLPADPSALDDAQGREVFDRAWRLTPIKARHPRTLAGNVEALVEVSTRKPLSARATGLLIAGWFAGWAIAGYGAVESAGGFKDPPVEWTTYHSTAGRFAIEVPGLPLESTTKDQTIMVATDGTHEVAVLWVELSAGSAPGWIAGTRAKVIGDHPILRDVGPGEAVYRIDDRDAHARLVTHGDRGYLVIVTAPTDDAGSERVIRSFRPDP